MPPTGVVVDNNYREYAVLLLRHHELLTEGKEADAEPVEDQMTDLWEALDDGQRRSLKGVGSDLAWVRRGGAVTSRGPKAIDVTEMDRLRLSKAEGVNDWHAILHHLRVCAPVLSPGEIALSRATAYAGIGLPTLGQVFRDFATSPVASQQG